MGSTIYAYAYARLATVADTLRGRAPCKQDLSQVRPFFEAAAALMTPEARTARSARLLDRGLQLPEELCTIIAAHLAQDAATNVELAYFAAFSPRLQQTALRAMHAAVMRQGAPMGLSWCRYLDELSRLQLPRSDAECIYRVFAGTFPPALAVVWPWAEPALRTLACTQLMSAQDRDEQRMRLFFTWAGQTCTQAMLRDHERFLFVGSSANRHQEGWADSPYGTPNQIALTFAPSATVFDAATLEATGIAPKRLTCVGCMGAAFRPPVLSDMLKAKHEVLEDHIARFVPPLWTAGYVDNNVV